MRHEIPGAPPVLLLGDAVVLRGAAAVEAYRLMTKGAAAVQRQDGISPNPRVRQMLLVLEAAARMSAGPVTDVRKESTPATCATGTRIGTREAADLMGITERHVRRRADELGGIQSRGRWTYDQTAVLAAAERNDR
jgi:hypothetical protein